MLVLLLLLLLCLSRLVRLLHECRPGIQQCTDFLSHERTAASPYQTIGYVGKVIPNVLDELEACLFVVLD